MESARDEEEEEQEDEYEEGSSTGKRRSLGEGDRTPRKRRKVDVSNASIHSRIQETHATVAET